METLYHLVCLVLRGFERWQNNRRAEMNKGQKDSAYKELQSVNKKW